MGIVVQGHGSGFKWLLCYLLALIFSLIFSLLLCIIWVTKNLKNNTITNYINLMYIIPMNNFIFLQHHMYVSLNNIQMVLYVLLQLLFLFTLSVWNSSVLIQAPLLFSLLCIFKLYEWNQKLFMRSLVSKYLSLFQDLLL